MLFSEAVAINPKRQLPREGQVPFLDMASLPLNGADVSVLTAREISSGGSKFQSGDTLFARITPSAENGKLGFVQSINGSQVAQGSTEFIVMAGRDGLTLPEYVRYLAGWSEVRDQAIGLMEGTSGRQRVPQSAFDEIEVPIPPLDEQRRIVEVLRSVDEVHRLNQLSLDHLQLLRKLALRDLFTAAEGEEFEDTILGTLPQGWAAVPADDICEAVIDCKNRTPPTTETGFAVVRTPNVRDGRFVRRNLVRTDPDSFEEWTRRGRPKVGDVLITREAPIGEVCAVPDDEPICLGQRMMLYRPNPAKLASSFLLYALQSEPVQDHLRNLGGGSTVGHVRVGDIRQLPIPCPPLAIQMAVAKTLEEIDIALDRAAGAFAQTAELKISLASDLLTGRVRVPE
ncbi:restriction endonuclease subunit S [Bradyrhizobium elkanii]